MQRHLALPEAFHASLHEDGLFGMNVGGIPFADGSSSSWAVVGLVAVFTALAGLWALGKRPQ